MNDQTYFLANAAHELQTLLSLLCSSIQAIEAAHPEVRCYRYWPELSSDCRLMTKLLRDLTDYSMSDQLTKQRSDLCNLLRRAYLSCLPLTEGLMRLHASRLPKNDGSTFKSDCQCT